MSVALLGCEGEDTAGADGSCNGAKCDAPDDDGDDDAGRRVCFGVRGNGQLIFAHFGSLARIYETYGLMWGASGGSSGSITTFLADSIQMNPQVTTCGKDACSDQEAGARAALLFKSLQGYVGALKGTPEALALQQLAPLAAQIQAEGLSELALTDVEAARESLLAILTSDDVADLVNDEVIALITNSPDPAFHVRDVVDSISKLAEFDASDDVIFVRPGLIDFEKFAEKIGRIANFYAGYGPVDAVAMERFFQSCATPGKGLMWDELASIPAGEGDTCGSLLEDAVTRYRGLLLEKEDAFPKRVDDQVGANMHTLISTSVLEGDAVREWSAARDAYFAAEDSSMDIDFNDVRFGYFGEAYDLQRIGDNPEGFDDLKTDKLRTLGQASWRTALTLSPAEPGLARAQEISDTQVSAGGWSDLHPTLVLRNLGCDEVVYVTRRGETSGFVTHDRRDAQAAPGGVATLLGMTDAQWAELYDVQSPSSFDLSLREADAVWCTNWNEQSAGDISKTVADAYNALLVSEDETWTRAYDKHGTGEGIAGCASIAPDPSGK